MENVFDACVLPWRIWPWGITLTHSDSDVSPECSVEFGVMIVRPTPPYEGLWTKLVFDDASFATAKPHRDDEDIADVTGYDIVPRRREFNTEVYEREELDWLETGVCGDPKLYFSTHSTWLTAESQRWADRQRGSMMPSDAIHFLLNGRDGYVEVLASAFTWQAWPYGSPRYSDVRGDPVMSGRWPDTVD